MNAYVHDIEHQHIVDDGDDHLHDSDALGLHMPVPNEEGDIVSAADLGLEFTELPDDDEFETRYHRLMGLGAEVAAMTVETSTTGDLAVQRESIPDWQVDLIRMQDLGLDVFSPEDYRSLTVKDTDIFQRVLRNFRRSAVNRAKRIKLVEGDLDIDPDLKNIYGKSHSPAELLAFADRLEQLVAAIDASGLIDKNHEKSKKELAYAQRNYSDVVIVKDEAGKLRVSHLSLRHSA